MVVEFFPDYISRQAPGWSRRPLTIANRRAAQLGKLRFSLRHRPRQPFEACFRIVAISAAECRVPFGAYDETLSVDEYYFVKYGVELALLLKSVSDHTIKWTEHVPERLVTKMIQYKEKLSNSSLKFRRHIDVKENEPVAVFTDASETTYGACIYLKTQKDGTPVTLPKEELIAAGLSSQAADGILKIGRKAEEEAERKGTAKNPLAAIGATIELLKNLDTFIKTQSKEDQDAYAVLFEKKKTIFEAQAKRIS